MASKTKDPGADAVSDLMKEAHTADHGGGSIEHAAPGDTDVTIPVDADLIDEIAEEALTSRKTRHCAECGTEFTPKSAAQRFCSKVCKNNYTNRELQRGSLLYKAAYRWRKNSRSSDPQQRKDGGSYLTFMTQMIDEWTKEDREAGRKPPTRPNW